MSVFSSVKALRPKRSLFNLSYSNVFTCDMGELVPVFCREMVPGDKFKVSNEVVVRLQPMVAPVLHEISVRTEYFFVPYRLFKDTGDDTTSFDFETFISGGKNGTTELAIPTLNNKVAFQKYTIWDYLGLPVGLTYNFSSDTAPVIFPQWAYNMIWNNYYMDETVDTPSLMSNYNLLRRRWKKDYFTSALPFQQRGVSPAFPVVGSAPVVFSNVTTGGSIANATGSVGYFRDSVNKTSTLGIFSSQVTASSSSMQEGDKIRFCVGNNSGNSAYGNLNADLSSTTTFNINDLRLAMQTQKWLERNARSGFRYKEFLLSHFGVSVADSRLDRPEFLGATKSPIIVSEVLQTSETTSTSPQGNLAGRGIGASGDFVCSYTAPEYGLIIGLMSICPKNVYSSQGINSYYLRRSRYDFYFPEFQHLSEQPIRKAELYYSGNDTDDLSTFGYQGIYDNMRHSRSMITSDMRDDFKYWTFAREFASAPSLNSSFLEMNPTKRPFAVQTVKEFIVHFGNIVKAIRPLSKTAEPGYIDHF